MFNLNEKYFSISERCGRNHQNKFCLRPLKGRFYPWELKHRNTVLSDVKHMTGNALEVTVEKGPSAGAWLFPCSKTIHLLSEILNCF